MMAGAGMALMMAPSASMILESVRDIEAGQASGAASTLREVGGVLGVAVMATVFQGSGSYASPQAYTDGVAAALPVAVVVLGVGAVLALALPGKRWMAERAAANRAADEAEAASITSVAAPAGRPVDAPAVGLASPA